MTMDPCRIYVLDLMELKEPKYDSHIMCRMTHLYVLFAPSYCPRIKSPLCVQLLLQREGSASR